MEKNLYELYSQIVRILRQDYAGKELCGERFDPRYYTQAIGQAAKDERLDRLQFFRYVNQMFAAIGDRHLAMELQEEGYEPHSPGFKVRRFEDSLIVTEVSAETRLRVGDVITHVQGGRPSEHRKSIQKNLFYSDTPEREDWSGLLKMAQTITLENGETLELRQYPRQPEARTPHLHIENGVALFDPGHFDGAGAAARLLVENEPALAACSRLVFDLRRGGGNCEEDFFPLLPWLCREKKTLRELLGDTDLYVNYTPLNCALRAQSLQGLDGAEDYIAELHAKSSRGFVRETEETEALPIAPKAPGEVLVLTDSWCRDAGESFVLAARRAGARLIGRPTLGTLDYCGDLALALDSHFVLRYPSAVSAAACEGHGMQDKGIEPDEYIPFTPGECRKDLLLARALEL